MPAWWHRAWKLVLPQLLSGRSIGAFKGKGLVAGYLFLRSLCSLRRSWWPGGSGRQGPAILIARAYASCRRVQRGSGAAQISFPLLRLFPDGLLVLILSRSHHTVVLTHRVLTVLMTLAGWRGYASLNTWARFAFASNGETHVRSRTQAARSLPRAGGLPHVQKFALVV